MRTWPFICKLNVIPVNLAKKNKMTPGREGWTGGRESVGVSLCRSACPLVSVDVCCRAHQDLLDLLGCLDLMVLLEFKDHG